MKTTILLIFSLILVTGSLKGQVNKLRFALNEVKDETNKSPFTPGYSSREKSSSGENFSVIKSLDTNIVTIVTDPEKHKKYYITPRTGKRMIIKYPPHYSKHFFAKPDTNGIIMVIKPDMSVKYFLLIK